VRSVILSLLGSFLLTALTREVLDNASYLAERLVSRALRRMLEAERERWTHELNAELDQMRTRRGKIALLTWALWVNGRSRRRVPVPMETEPVVPTGAASATSTRQSVNAGKAVVIDGNLVRSEDVWVEEHSKGPVHNSEEALTVGRHGRVYGVVVAKRVIAGTHRRLTT
jgi:hypothetical protein